VFACHKIINNLNPVSQPTGCLCWLSVPISVAHFCISTPSLRKKYSFLEQPTARSFDPSFKHEHVQHCHTLLRSQNQPCESYSISSTSPLNRHKLSIQDSSRAIRPLSIAIIGTNTRGEVDQWLLVFRQIALVSRIG
jgi:hypothetical protein